MQIYFGFLPDPDKEMKMVFEQCPGISFSNRVNILFVQAEKMVVIFVGIEKITTVNSPVINMIIVAWLQDCHIKNFFGVLTLTGFQTLSGLKT
jgi:hypothetical protein